MDSLEQVSLLVIWAAMISYAIALVAFAVDVSSLRADRDESGAVIKRSRRAASAVAAADEPGDTLVEAPPVESEPPADIPRGKAIGIATATLWLGFAFHVIGVVTRAIAAGHVPWSNLYELTITVTAVIVATYLVLDRTYNLRFLGIIVTLPLLLGLGAAVHIFYRAVEGIPPILDSVWLIIHVAAAVSAIAAFAIAALLAVLQLSVSTGWAKTNRWLAHLPDADLLERVSYRFAAVGFVLWTFTLVAGAIWANDAWSRPWGWDAKEVWTFVIWVIYAAYLHARATRGWDGRRAAILVLIGFMAVVANMTIVNYMFTTKHGYAG